MPVLLPSAVRGDNKAEKLRSGRLDLMARTPVNDNHVACLKAMNLTCNLNQHNAFDYRVNLSRLLMEMPVLLGGLVEDR
jgi:hypothetical protein